MMTRHTRANFGLTLSTLSTLLVVSISLLSMGCGDDTVPPPADGSTPRAEIGTGVIGEYTTVADGDTALLVSGSQGGQHVWVGLRAWNLDTAPALIQLRLEGETTGELLSIPFQVRLTFSDTRPPDADYTQLSGLALVIPDPGAALDEPVTIRARVIENRTGGLMAETSVSGLMVEWDPDNLPPSDRDAGQSDGGAVDAAVPGGDAGMVDASAMDAGTGADGG